MGLEKTVGLGGRRCGRSGTEGEEEKKKERKFLDRGQTKSKKFWWWPSAANLPV
jgi:hypothetical protein